MPSIAVYAGDTRIDEGSEAELSRVPSREQREGMDQGRPYGDALRHLRAFGASRVLHLVVTLDTGREQR
jgi:hypothetical protein